MPQPWVKTIAGAPAGPWVSTNREEPVGLASMEPWPCWVLVRRLPPRASSGRAMLRPMKDQTSSAAPVQSLQVSRSRCRTP